MVQIPSFLLSTFKELSNEYSHTQIRVKMKKLWPRQVGKEKQVAVQKLSRDQEIVLQPENLVATRRLGRDQKTWSRPGNCAMTRKLGRDLKKLCRDQLAVLRPKTLQKPKKGRKLIF